jgi:hypothetical protein
MSEGGSTVNGNSETRDEQKPRPAERRDELPNSRAVRP